MRSPAVLGATFANRFTTKPNYTPTTTLTTPTYDGSGQTTEPTWIKKPSWVTAVGTDLLLHNPLPGGNSSYENPCILISNDNGSSWALPPGAPNPIIPTPPAGDNCDCHIVADPAAPRFIITWSVQARMDNSGLNGVWYSICTDPTLVTWSAPVQLLSNAAASGQLEQEPKIVWDRPRGRYLLFTQDGQANHVKIRVGGTDPVSGYGSPTVINLTIPDGQTLWHMDIIQEPSGRFIMAFCDNKGGPARQGWLASSWDGLNWRCAPRPFMNVNSWASAGVYRPSIQPARSGNGYDIITARHQTPTAQLGLVRNVPASEVP
jgi:hypothetical protein